LEILGSNWLNADVSNSRIRHAALQLRNGTLWGRCGVELNAALQSRNGALWGRLGVKLTGGVKKECE
jgi:hypothetical protein